VFGILQRYVMGEILRAFSLALLTVTSVIVLFMVMIEATKVGLTPREIMNLVPFVIPSSLPYTIPVSLLFAVTVVFGRLASDNEIVAVKTAGLSAMTVLNPAIALGVILSVLLVYLSNELIPRSNTEAKLIIFKNMEEMFYKYLKKDREFNNRGWPFLIKVKDVEGKKMIKPVFKHRKSPDNPNQFDMIIIGDTAVIHFDTANNVARVYLDGAEIIDPRKDVSLINDTILEIPIPSDRGILKEKRIQEWTTREMVVEQATLSRNMAKERKRQAFRTALLVAMGRVAPSEGRTDRTWQIDWGLVHRSFIDYGVWAMKWKEYETEKQMRFALACGSLFFVLLGAPVGILFARRDFLSAFISCFVPIIVMYYPLVLLGSNMGRDGLLNATVALWLGNAVLAALSVFVLPPVMRH
jgi:lipopolysaccharide export system permease protein